MMLPIRSSHLESFEVETPGADAGRGQPSGRWASIVSAAVSRYPDPAAARVLPLLPGRRKPVVDCDAGEDTPRSRSAFQVRVPRPRAGQAVHGGLPIGAARRSDLRAGKERRLCL